MTRERIVDAALALVEAGGAGQLSMRKLAAELGTVPTTIYWHVGGREELLDALVERFSERLVASEVEGATPADRVVALAHVIRDRARRHQHITALAYERGRAATLALPLQLALARELTAAGLTGAAAGRAMRSILYVVGGFIVLEPRLAAGAGGQAAELWRDAGGDGIDPGILAELREPVDLDAVFDHSLRSLVDALLPAG